MTKDQASESGNRMSRSEMQTEALVIENLLNAAMSMFGDENREESMTLIEMACDRAHKLNRALDIINEGDAA